MIFQSFSWELFYAFVLPISAGVIITFLTDLPKWVQNRRNRNERLKRFLGRIENYKAPHDVIAILAALLAIKEGDINEVLDGSLIKENSDAPAISLLVPDFRMVIQVFDNPRIFIQEFNTRAIWDTWEQKKETEHIFDEFINFLKAEYLKKHVIIIPHLHLTRQTKKSSSLVEPKA